MNGVTDNERRYGDIINLPHHRSAIHSCMSMQDRAMQFAPFAALTGHDDAIEETARLTDDFNEPDESKMSDLSSKLQILKERFAEQPEVTFIYFLPDEKKSGGAYAVLTGIVRRIDEYERLIIMNGEEKFQLTELLKSAEIYSINNPSSQEDCADVF